MPFLAVTWNSQGEVLDGCEARLKSIEPNVMVVQEAGNLAALFVQRSQQPGGPPLTFDPDKIRFGKPVNLGKVLTYNCWWVAWSRQDPNGTRYAGKVGNIRCSLAMFYREHAMPSVIEPTYLSKKGALKKRPVMLAKLGTHLVANIHAGGQDYIRNAVSYVDVKSLGSPWLVAGDFNQQPRDLRDKDLIPRDANIIAPDKVSRKASHRLLDYGVSDQLGSARGKAERPGVRDDPDDDGMVTRSKSNILTLGLSPDYLGSDHQTVTMLLGVRPAKRKRYN